MKILGIEIFEILDKLIKSGICIILGMLLYNFIKKIILKSVQNNRLKEMQHIKKMKTVSSILLNLNKYGIGTLVVLAILAIFGINVTTIVAGLGVVAALVGLAFQDTAKDIIAGFSIITDDQYNIGDTIEIDGFRGEVVFLGLRTTRIRDYKGATKIISNHTINKVINYNLHDSLAIVDVAIAYECDTDKALKVLNKLAEELKGKIKFATGDIEVWGIDSLSDSAIIYRVVLPSKPMQHFVVQRELRKEIKDTLDKNGIKIPYSQIEVHNAK